MQKETSANRTITSLIIIYIIYMYFCDIVTLSGFSTGALYTCIRTSCTYCAQNSVINKKFIRACSLTRTDWKGFSTWFSSTGSASTLLCRPCGCDHLAAATRWTVTWSLIYDSYATAPVALPKFSQDGSSTQDHGKRTAKRIHNARWIPLYCLDVFVRGFQQAMTYKRMEHHAAVYAHILLLCRISPARSKGGHKHTSTTEREREREKYAHMFNIDDVHIYNS